MIQKNTSRGQSNILGAILLIGLSILAFSIYVTQIVPIFTAQAEYSTYQEIETEMISINDTISAVASNGIQQTQSLSFTTDYPFFQTPKHRSQSVYTDDATTSISYNTTTVSLETDILNYDPTYNTITQSPIHIENGMVVRSNSEITNPSQGVIDDNSISITGVSSVVNTADATNIPLRVTQEESAFTTTVTAEPTVTIDTKLSEQKWNEMLEPELAENGGNIDSIDYQEYTNSPNQLEVGLHEDTYTITTTKVNLSS